MFSYYGSKSRVAKMYPKPVHDKIIEPFAGSARYSLEYWDRDVLLVDKYEVVVRVWKFLQQCSKNDILKLPRLVTGLDLRTLNLSEDELLFMGMCAGAAGTGPRYKVSAFIGQQNGNKNRMIRIADQLHKIKHWEIRHGDYTEIINQKATWFIDPPYQFGGHAYKEKFIDFKHLAQWSIERQGQAIVCENDKADWLPFSPLYRVRGASGLFATEVIWTNLETSYNVTQQTLFRA